MSDIVREEFDVNYDDENPARPQTLRQRYLGRSMEADERLSRLMLWHACPIPLRRDIDRQRSVVVIVEIPSSEWMDLIFDAARALFRNAQFLRKSKSQTTQDTALRTAIPSGQSVIMVCADSLKGIHEAIVASVDYHLRVVAPDRAKIAATIRATFGNKSVSGIPAHVGSKAPPSALISTIRRRENAGRAVMRLIELDRRLSRGVHTDPSGPTLDHLHGYGSAKDWGLQLAADLQAYRRGEIAWSELSSAALLHGAPGTGKTFFASALARSCGVQLIATSLSEIFNTSSGYLDGIIKGLSRAFAEARDCAPAILFIDEMDALPDRATLSGRNRDWWTSVITHVLKLMDDSRDGVVVLGATNMFDRLDAALLRSGRLEKHFHIELPDQGAIAAMLRHHLGDRLPDIDLPSIARLARGATGADIALLVKTAASTARREARELNVDDITDLLVRDGMPPDQIRRISVHEAGHAIIAHVLGRKVHHLTTLRRGDYLGTANIEAPGLVETRARLEEAAIINLAGRNSEILLLGEACDGAGVDLKRATMFASSIHASFGLGSSLVHRAEPANTPALIEDPQFRDLIEAELRILDARCMVLLTTHQESLKAVANQLQKRRALSADEFYQIVSP
jgi:hypothetical protein